ncbi:MAG: hypothetical protein QM756_20630 [Polyangiaceae bacterium]
MVCSGIHWVSVIAVGSLGCAARPSAPASPLKAASSAASPDLASPYRFLAVQRGPDRVQRLADGGVGALVSREDGGMHREVVHVDGSVERSRTHSSDMLLGGVPVPARMGGGFLFWNSDALFRAPSWIGELTPITRLATNAIGVEFGYDFVLLFTSEVSPRALRLTPPYVTGLSPKGLIEVVASDDGRVLAFDAAGRIWASLDGARSYRDVTRELQNRVIGLDSNADGVACTLSEDKAAWLQKDGSFVVKPHARNRRAQWEPLERVAGNALPLPGERALVGDSGGVAVVDLKAGSVTSTKALAQPEVSCAPLALADEGIAACYYYAANPSLSVVSHVLAAKETGEKSFVGTPHVVASEEVVVVSSSCAGVAMNGLACVRGAGGTWRDVDVQATLNGQELLFWVPREGGGVVGVVSRLREGDGPPRAASIDPTDGALVTWDLSLDKIDAALLQGASGANWVATRDGTLRGYTAHGALVVDKRGHVTLGERRFEAVAGSRQMGLARDAQNRLFQSSDSGAHWFEVEAPPHGFFVEPPLEKRTGLLARLPSVPVMGCSPAGCSIDHSSGIGTWLRLGWPLQGPRAPARAATFAATVAFDEQAPAEPPSPQLPQLHCSVQGTPKKQPNSWTQVAKNEPLATYGDVFGTDTILKHGMRGTVHFARARFDASFVEPFEPEPRVLKARGVLASAADAAAGSDSGAARPVLSARLGRSDGVLLTSDDLSLWVSAAGKARPVRPKCSAESGYVDARGKLFVACGGFSGATRVENTETGEVVLRLPAAARYHDNDDVGMKFFPPGEPQLLNPDAIAVATDGSLGVVRVASVEPATVDNPAWFLSDAKPPVELAPWATLELASSPACAGNSGYRAVVQTRKPWVELEGAKGFSLPPGMSALVRWSPERVCLEAVENRRWAVAKHRAEPRLHEGDARGALYGRENWGGFARQRPARIVSSAGDVPAREAVDAC